MLSPLTLTPPCLEVRRPTWLFAQTCQFLNRAASVVYRSVMVDEDFAPYAGVLSYLKDHGFELAWKGRFLDVDMMFGEGELMIYVTPTEDDSYGFELDPETMEILRTEGLRILKDLTSAIN